MSYDSVADVPKYYRALEEFIERMIPGASLDYDNQGQIIIYTGLCLANDDTGELKSYDPAEVIIDDD